MLLAILTKRAVKATGPIGELEVARCDSDPSMPEHGHIRFWVRPSVELRA